MSQRYPRPLSPASPALVQLSVDLSRALFENRIRPSRNPVGSPETRDVLELGLTVPAAADLHRQLSLQLGIPVSD